MLAILFHSRLDHICISQSWFQDMCVLLFFCKVRVPLYAADPVILCGGTRRTIQTAVKCGQKKQQRKTHRATENGLEPSLRWLYACVCISIWNLASEKESKHKQIKFIPYPLHTYYIHTIPSASPPRTRSPPRTYHQDKGNAFYGVVYLFHSIIYKYSPVYLCILRWVEWRIVENSLLYCCCCSVIACTAARPFKIYTNEK